MQFTVKYIFYIIALIILFQISLYSQIDSNMVFKEPANKSKSFARPVDLPHKIGLFVGGASAGYYNKMGLAFGFNYRLKVMELLGPKYSKWNIIGVGFNIENNLFSNNEIAVSAGAIIFLSNNFWLYFYPGMRYFSEEKQFNTDSELFKERMFWRIGGSYDLSFKDIIISPSIYSDVIDEQFSFTLGVAFLYQF